MGHSPQKDKGRSVSEEGAALASKVKYAVGRAKHKQQEADNSLTVIKSRPKAGPLTDVFMQTSAAHKVRADSLRVESC